MDVYPHMRIICVACAHACVARAMAAQCAYITHWPIGPILGFWGTQLPKMGDFAAQDTDEPMRKIWRC